MKSDRPDLTSKLNPRLFLSEPAPALFGSDSREELTGRWIIFFITFCLALAALLFLRRPDALLNPQFWAEDGNLFFAEQFYGQAWLFEPYAGYLTLIPRLVAKFADLFPVALAPLLYNLAALVLASGCCAWFALPCFRHLVRDDKLRILACLMIALMPAVGTILLNLSNIQWYLPLWCGLVCLMPFPRGKTRWALLLVYLLFLFSSPLTFIFLPIWLLRAGFVRADRKASLTMVAVHGIYAILIKHWVSASARTYRAFHPLAAAINAAKLVLTRVGIMGLLGPKFFAHSFSHQRYFLISMGVGCLIFAGAILWQARGQKRFLIQTGLFAYLVFSSVALFTLVRTGNPPEDLYFTGGGARYFFFGTALFYLWLLMALDRLRSDLWVRAGIIGLIVWLGFSVKQHFSFVQTFQDLQWPRWAEGFEQARLSHARFPLDVPINPRPWVVPGSGQLPPDTASIPLPPEPTSSTGVVQQGRAWQSLAPHALLHYRLPAPKYLYALRLRYALSGPGPEPCAAQLAWRSRPEQAFRHDAGIQLLEATEGETSRMIWLADTAGELQIEFSRADCKLELDEITLLASPHPVP